MTTTTIITEKIYSLIRKELKSNIEYDYNISKAIESIKEKFIFEKIDQYNLFELNEGQSDLGDELQSLNDFNEIENKIIKFYSNRTEEEKTKEIIESIPLIYKMRDATLEERKINIDLYRIREVKLSNSHLNFGSFDYEWHVRSMINTILPLLNITKIDEGCPIECGNNLFDEYSIRLYKNGNVKLTLPKDKMVQLNNLIKKYHSRVTFL